MKYEWTKNCQSNILWKFIKNTEKEKKHSFDIIRNIRKYKHQTYFIQFHFPLVIHLSNKMLIQRQKNTKYKIHNINTHRVNGMSKNRNKKLKNAWASSFILWNNLMKKKILHCWPNTTTKYFSIYFCFVLLRYNQRK